MSHYETDLPPKQKEKSTQVRIPQTHEDSGWTCSTKPSSSPRLQTPLRLTKLSFSKSARILKRAHFKKIVRNRCKWSGSTLLIDYRKGAAKCAKLGLTVTKRFGKAHDRNRFKRLVRESFRLLYPEIPSDLEMNILPRKRNAHPGAILNDLKSFLSTLSNR